MFANHVMRDGVNLMVTGMKHVQQSVELTYNKTPRRLTSQHVKWKQDQNPWPKTRNYGHFGPPKPPSARQPGNL